MVLCPLTVQSVNQSVMDASRTPFAEPKKRQEHSGMDWKKGLNEKIPEDAIIMPWLVRWAAELMSKYSVGDGGRSPYERIRGSKCMTPLVPFGQTHENSA